MKELSYPLDAKTINRKKRSIKRKLLSRKGLVEKKIAILGGSSTSDVKDVLELFLLNSGIKPLFYESEYNRFYEDAVFGNKEFDSFAPDIVYIHTSVKNIVSFPKIADSEDDVGALSRAELSKFEEIWDALQRFNCAIIQNNFDYTQERVLGNLDCSEFHGKTRYIIILNQEFSCAARSRANVYLSDINYLSSYVGLQRWFDQSLWLQAKYAVSMNAIPELAFNLSKIICALFGKSKKCLVLDLDNTCWGGVIGDDGLAGIQIGVETSVAEAYTDFQKYIRELKERGVMLAVCSKNDYETAKQGFSHPSSILKFTDFASFIANWREKNVNVELIANEINLGIDSLVFIDDNPMERDLVSAQLPVVSVPNVGYEVVDFIRHIDRNGYFESVSLSQDDLQRNSYYESNKLRVKSQAAFNSYSDYLTSLEMVAQICSFDAIHLERITQLTNKTNQFNLTTKRYTTAEIQAISSSRSHIAIYGKLSDKFGDNGLVAVTIGAVQDETCHIELWLMSCRVLKRSMELAMLDELVSRCRASGVTAIVGRYIETQKNHMVRDLYGTLGFDLISQSGSESVWRLETRHYEPQNCKIALEIE